jgi:impB/mucB/samB family C-terminal domain
LRTASTSKRFFPLMKCGRGYRTIGGSWPPLKISRNASKPPSGETLATRSKSPSVSLRTATFPKSPQNAETGWLFRHSTRGSTPSPSSLTLREIHGVAKNMESRLHAGGIHTVEELCAASRQLQHGVWGGVLGDRLWHLLQGVEIPDLVSARKSIGHSHVLPPDLRHPAKAWPILCKLLHKACVRLRSHGMVAGKLSLNLAFFRGPA